MLVTPVPNSQFSHRKKKKKEEGFWLILVYF